MAHFARIENNIVTEIHPVANAVILDKTGDEQESIGQQFLANLFGGTPENWLQCSYNATFRHMMPYLNCQYLPHLDVFVEPRPSNDAVFDEDSLTWVSPDETV